MRQGDLGPQPAPGQLGKYLRGAAASDEGVEHVAAGLAQDVRRHAGQLDPGVLEHLVEALGLPGPFLHAGAPIAGEVAQLPDWA